jgi:hypothetical protein
LRLESRTDVVTLHSDPFAAPITGRLSMHVWLRWPAEGAPPSLRLAVEGQLNGQPYYRFASVEPTPDVQEDWAPFVLHIDDLPDDGLTDLRVRFDLMGAGTIWLDDVELYDLSFTRSEQRETSKVIALADLQLREGRLTDCWYTLDRFWPRYLLKYVTATQPNVAALPTQLGPFEPPPMDPAPPEPAASPLQKMRDLMPPWPWDSE